MQREHARPQTLANRDKTSTKGLAKIEQTKANLAMKVQRGSFNVLNQTVHPFGWAWLAGPLLPVLAWVLIPRLRAKVVKSEVYRSPRKIKRLYSRFWAPLGWFGLGWSVLCLVLLEPAFSARWGVWHAWFGLRWNLGLANVVLIGWAGAAIIAFAALMLLFRGSREARRNGEHGAAAWSTWGEIICSPVRRWGIPIRAHYRGVRRNWGKEDTGTGITVLGPPDAAVCAHFLVNGSSGSGKGVSIFGHIMASSKVPVIYQDVKAEVPFVDSPKMKSALRWGCAADDGWPSLRWNPLEEARQEKEGADRDSAFQALAAILMPRPAGREDSWVQEVGRPVLAEALKTGRFETLGDFADFVRDMPLKDMLKHLEVPAGLQGLMAGTNVPEYVASTFYSNLACYRSGWGRVVTSGHDFSLDDFIHQGGYILSAESEESRSQPLKLFWNMLFNKLMRSTGKIPLTILMDEGLSAGKIPNLRQALETLRNREVSLWLAIQSESGLYDVYGPTAGKAILDTFGNRITLLHGLDSADAESLSKRLGNWTLRRRQPKMGNPQVSAVPLLTPSEISVRGKRLEDRWAVFESRESSTSGLPILSRTLQAPFPTRRPTKAELVVFYEKYPDLHPDVTAKLGIGKPPCFTKPGSKRKKMAPAKEEALKEAFGPSHSEADPFEGAPWPDEGEECEGYMAHVASLEALGGD